MGRSGYGSGWCLVATSRWNPDRVIMGRTSIGVVLAESLSAVQVPYAVLGDFTEPDSALERLLTAIDRGWGIVVGTTEFSV